MKKTKLEISIVLSKALLMYLKKKPFFLGIVTLITVGFILNFAPSFFGNGLFDCHKDQIVTTNLSEVASVQKSTACLEATTMEEPCENLKQYLRDRPFIDSFPVDPRKTYKIYIFGKDDMGVFITARNFRQVIELFTYKVSGDTIAFDFLNANVKGKSPFKIVACDGPGTFDISLELKKDIKSNNHRGVYYSSKKIKPASMPGLILNL